MSDESEQQTKLREDEVLRRIEHQRVVEQEYKRRYGKDLYPKHQDKQDKSKDKKEEEKE